MQCSAVQCSAVQCSAVQCSAVQCSAVYNNAVGRYPHPSFVIQQSGTYSTTETEKFSVTLSYISLEILDDIHFLNIAPRDDLC